MRLDAEARIADFPDLVLGLLARAGNSCADKGSGRDMFAMGKAMFRTVSRSLSETVPFRKPMRIAGHWPMSCQVGEPQSKLNASQSSAAGR